MSAIATPLRNSAIILIVVSIVLGIVVSPIIFIGVAIGVIDLIIATAISRGWFGRSASGEDDTASRVEADPSYNPYARED